MKNCLQSFKGVKTFAAKLNAGVRYITGTPYISGSFGLEIGILARGACLKHGMAKWPCE